MAELCLYRFLQEALTNVARHAKTDRAWVHLSDNNGWVRLSVADVGLGFAFQQNGPLHSSAAGIGLLGMQERLEAVGGKLRILSAPGRGTEVEAAVPIVRNDLGEEESPPLQTVVLMEG
jgi:signal transduction histidine kinase